MAHGAYSKRRVSATRRSNSKPLGVAKKPKPSVSLKNQIRSLERMLRKVTLTLFLSLFHLVDSFLFIIGIGEAESASRGERGARAKVRSTEEAARDSHAPRCGTQDFFTWPEDQVLREEENWKANQTPRETAPCLFFFIFFFCPTLLWPAFRSKTRSSICHGSCPALFCFVFFFSCVDITTNIDRKKTLLLFKINFNLQYFPKNEKYVPLFTGGDDSEIVDRRNGLRKQIEDRLIAAAASGKDLEGSLIVNFYNTHQLWI